MPIFIGNWIWVTLSSFRDFTLGWYSWPVFPKTIVITVSFGPSVSSLFFVLKKILKLALNIAMWLKG